MIVMIMFSSSSYDELLSFPHGNINTDNNFPSSGREFVSDYYQIPFILQT